VITGLGVGVLLEVLWAGWLLAEFGRVMAWGWGDGVVWLIGWFGINKAGVFGGGRAELGTGRSAVASVGQNHLGKTKKDGGDIQSQSTILPGGLVGLVVVRH